jgi:hypothetical protein
MAWLDAQYLRFVSLLTICGEAGALDVGPCPLRVQPTPQGERATQASGAATRARDRTSQASGVAPRAVDTAFFRNVTTS